MQPYRMQPEVFPPDPGAAALRGEKNGDAAERSRGLLLPRLSMMGEQLKETSSHIEESVIEVCSRFQGIADRASTGSARTQDFLTGRHNGAQQGPSFERLLLTCEATMSRLIEASNESGSFAQQAIERVQGVDDKAREIISTLDRLEEFARGNKILALNARIEAAHSGASGAGFAAVAIELSSQTDKSREVTNGVAELTHSLRSMADATIRDLRLLHDQVAERTTQCTVEVQETILALRKTHAAMQSMLGATTEESSLLINDIGLAVQGLQFQDRVSQRIAHVVKDLEVFERKLRAEFDLDQDSRAFADEDFSGMVMREERAIYGVSGDEAEGGDIELF